MLADGPSTLACISSTSRSFQSTHSCSGNDFLSLFKMKPGRGGEERDFHTEVLLSSKVHSKGGGYHDLKKPASHHDIRQTPKTQIKFNLVYITITLFPSREHARANSFLVVIFYHEKTKKENKNQSTRFFLSLY